MDLPVVIKYTDMPAGQANQITVFAKQALSQNTPIIEKDVAKILKAKVERQYKGTWQCVIGRHFACSVSYELKSFIYFYVGVTGFLCFKM
jgi:hypothetical protein